MSIRLVPLCVAYLVLASGCHRDAPRPADKVQVIHENPRAKIANPVLMQVDSDIAKLLEFRDGARAPSEFVDRLDDLSKKHDWQKQLIECKKLSFFGWFEARAITIQTEQAQYVVVLMRSCTQTIPGSDVQTAILLDHKGKYLDQ